MDLQLRGRVLSGFQNVATLSSAARLSNLGHCPLALAGCVCAIRPEIQCEWSAAEAVRASGMPEHRLGVVVLTGTAQPAACQPVCVARNS